MSDAEPAQALRDCESLLADEDELQWRHVKAAHVSDSADGLVVQADAFQDDSQCVSTSRESLVSAEEAYAFHASRNKQVIAGTWAVSVAEITSVDCRAVDDHECVDVDTPGHSYIDMRELGMGLSTKAGKKARKTARTVLATRATSRGRQHP